MTEDQPPPFLRSWGRIYAVVLAHLLLWISLLYAFTLVFDPAS